MSTATEVLMRMEGAQPKLEAIRRGLDSAVRNLSNDLILFSVGREVSAKRARKLRKRGEVVRYRGRTMTGKPRFCWLPMPTPKKSPP